MLGSDAMCEYDAIIIGAGIVGSSAAKTLSKSMRVLLLEQHQLLHAKGGSTGGPRHIIVDDPRTEKAWDAWMALNEEEKLLEPVGSVYISYTLLGTIVLSCALKLLYPIHKYISRLLLSLGLKKSSVGSTTLESGTFLGSAGLRQLLPGFQFPWYACGLHSSKAGMLYSERCLAYFQRKAKEQGAEVKENCKVLDIRVEEDGVNVTCAGCSMRCRYLVIAAGGWSAHLLQLLGIRAQAKITTFTCPYFEGDVDGTAGLKQCPVFSFLGPFFCCYGFPLSDMNHILAIRPFHSEQQSDDPNNGSADLTVVTKIQETMGRFLPHSLKTPTEIKTCQYAGLRIGHDTTDTMQTLWPTSLGIIDRVPGCHGRVILAAGVDGHGFKFGSLYGMEIENLLSEHGHAIPQCAWPSPK